MYMPLRLIVANLLPFCGVTATDGMPRELIVSFDRTRGSQGIHSERELPLFSDDEFETVAITSVDDDGVPSTVGLPKWSRVGRDSREYSRALFSLFSEINRLDSRAAT
jgi:hypothetical protein